MKRSKSGGARRPPWAEALWPSGAPGTAGGEESPSITVHLAAPEKANGTAVVVCPGGGYVQLMMTYEGHDIAKWLNGHGYAGIVVRYRVSPHRHPCPFQDGRRAMRIVRAKANEWGISPGRIGMMGFSAGGHLASTVGTHFDGGDPSAADPIERAGCRPDFMVLVYPLITLGEKGHAGAARTLLGESPSAADIEFLSNEKHVTDRTPPTLLVHSRLDEVVSVENSALFHRALRARNVPTELFELPRGAHGLGCGKGAEWAAWQAECLKWMGSLSL